MPKTTEKTMYQLVGDYTNLLGRFGLDSSQVAEFRRSHRDNEELIRYADTLDRIKRHLRKGSPCPPKSGVPVSR